MVLAQFFTRKRHPHKGWTSILDQLDRALGAVPVIQVEAILVIHGAAKDALVGDGRSKVVTINLNEF